MRTTSPTRHAPAHTHEPYLDLVRRFPLRPLKSEREYDRAAAFLFTLSAKGERIKLSRGERDYIDALVHFIHDWDTRQGHLSTSALTPLDVLKHLMEQRGMNSGDLGRVLGSQSTASLILNGKRELNKAHIQTIAAHFHVDAGLFFD